MTLFNEAYHFAERKHRGQLRLDGEPYFNHLLRVVDNLNEKDIQDQSLCAVAILHDTMEDTGTTFNELYYLFGNDITHSVSLLTKPEGEKYEIYINTIKDSKDYYAIKVKIADLKDNLRTIDNVPDKEKRERLKNRYEKALKELI